MKIMILIVKILVQKINNGGPTPDELLHELDQCDLSNSHTNTPSMSPCINSSLITHPTRLKSSNIHFLNQNASQNCSDL